MALSGTGGKDRQVPTPATGRHFSKRTMRFAWHGGTVMLFKTKIALAAVAMAATFAAAPAKAAPLSSGPTDVDFGVTIGPAPGPYYGYDEEYTGPTFGLYAYSEP